MTGVYRIETDAHHSRGFLYQITRKLSAFSGHHLTRRQCEAERIRLIFKVKNDLSRHVHFSPGCFSH